MAGSNLAKRVQDHDSVLPEVDSGPKPLNINLDRLLINGGQVKIEYRYVFGSSPTVDYNRDGNTVIVTNYSKSKQKDLPNLVFGLLWIQSMYGTSDDFWKTYDRARM